MLEAHFAIMAVWLYVAVAYFMAHGFETLPKKDDDTFANLFEYVTVLFTLPLYTVTAFLADYYGKGTKQATEIGDFRDALFSSILFPALFVIWALFTFTEGKTFNYVSGENLMMPAGAILDQRSYIFFITMCVQLYVVDHGLLALTTDIVRSAEGTVFFAILSFSLQAFFGSENTHKDDAIDAATNGCYFFLVCVVGGLYRRTLTDFLHPAAEDVSAAPEAAPQNKENIEISEWQILKDKAAPQAAPQAAKVPAAPDTNTSLWSEPEDTAPADEPAKQTKTNRKKKEPTPEPEPESESESEDDSYDEEAVEAFQMTNIPKELRMDSPGRKANPIVTGSRRRRAPTRYTEDD